MALRHTYKNPVYRVNYKGTLASTVGFQDIGPPTPPGTTTVATLITAVAAAHHEHGEGL